MVGPRPRILLTPPLTADYVRKKENWRILSNAEIYAAVEKSTVTETVRLHRLHWFGDGQILEGNRIPRRVIYYTG
jgi:hypothetical protein